LIVVQFQRLIHSKFFYISLLVGSIITISQYVQTAWTIIRGEALYGKASTIPDSAYLLWLNTSLSEITNLFLMLLPVLAVLPYSLQLLVDKKTNYSQLMIMKSGKYKYLFSMLTMSAFSGFLVVAIPIFVNFLLFSLTFPAISPNPFVYYIYGIDAYDTLFFNLRLNAPLIHTMIYIFLSGLVGSLFAVFTTTLCLYFRYTLIILAIPLFINLLISVVDESFTMAVSPLNFLKMTVSLPVHLWDVLLFALLMIFLTCILLGIGVRRLAG